VVQRGERSRFAFEPCDPVGVGRQRFGQHLDRDDPPELRVARAVDLSHAAGAEQGDDLVTADTHPGG